MTGYEIRNAIRRTYGIDAADHLFDTHDDGPKETRFALARLVSLLATAVKGVL